MDNNQQSLKKSFNQPAANKQGCGTIVLLVFVSIWILAFSGLDLFLGWTIEQTLYETSIGAGDFRWMIHLVYAFLIFIPLLLLYIYSKAPRMKLVYRLWMIGAVFAFLCIPIKTMYVTYQNQTSGLQLGAMLLMLLGMKLFSKNDQKLQKTRERSQLIGIVSLAGLGMSIPWLLWGAWGSVIDTILAMAVGVSFGFLVVEIIFPFLLDKTQEIEREVRVIDFFLDGFVIAVFLLILVAGIGQNGSQQLLVITVPISGWIITAFSIAGRGMSDRGKFAAGVILALAIALPILFFDMDELSLVIASGPGEVLEWANKAAWFTFMSILIATVLLLANFNWIRMLNLSKRINAVLAATAVTVFGVIYAVFGQTGFYGDHLFVILKSQADLSNLPVSGGLVERNESLYRLLVTTAEDSQSEIRMQLSKWGISFQPYYLVNAIEVTGGPLVKFLLEENPLVDRVLDNPRLRPLPQVQSANVGEMTQIPGETPWNLELIGIDKVRDELGVTGKGIVIGQTDSGADGTSPEIGASYRGYKSSDDYNWLDPWYKTASPVDQSGHGTATLGIEVGENLGIAPEAEWIGCVNLARNLGNPALYLDCMQFMFAPYPQDGNAFTDGDVTKAAMIINNSWGCPRVEGCDPLVFEKAGEILKAAGIFMSSAAGNTGYYGCATISDPPAIYSSVFTVGSINQLKQISPFSSLGPVLIDGSNRSKPDLLAPGENILLAYTGGTYTIQSGTSFAAPHVTGVVALMWSANPSLIGNIDETVRILRETAEKYYGQDPECGDPANGSGSGILDAYAAVSEALRWKEIP